MREKPRRRYIEEALRRTWVTCLVFIVVGGLLGAAAFLATHTQEESKAFPTAWASCGAFLGLMFTLLILVPVQRAKYELVLDQNLDRADRLNENLAVAQNKLDDWERFKIAGLNDAAHRYVAHALALWLSAAEDARVHAAKDPKVNGDLRLVEQYKGELDKLISVARARQGQYIAACMMIRGLGFTLMDDREYHKMVQAKRSNLGANQIASEVEELGQG